jgi:hypothetical protein
MLQLTTQGPLSTDPPIGRSHTTHKYRAQLHKQQQYYLILRTEIVGTQQETKLLLSHI